MVEVQREIKNQRGRDRHLLRSRRFFFYILIATLVSTMILTYIWTFVKVAEARVVYQELQKKQSVLKKNVEQLEVKKAHLSSPSRIDELARTHLNMSLPDRVEFLSIEYVKDSEHVE